MYFLLYIPIINQPLSPELIEQMAAQLAERLGTPPAGDDSASNTKELKKQIVDMMTAMQEQRARLRDADAAASTADPAEDGAEDDAGEDDYEGSGLAHLAPARDFLERCLKNSA